MSENTGCCEGNNFWFDGSVTGFFVKGIVDAGINVHLVSAAYQPRKGIDETIANIPAAAIIATQPLAGAMAKNRRLYGNPVTFPEVSKHFGEVSAIVLTTAAGDILAYMDNVHGLGIKPDSTNLTITWDTGGIAGL